MACRRVTETVREREVFRHDSVLISNSIRNDVKNLIPSSQLRACPDPSLTALAELACLRLGATRALISLFDREHQHVVAEATPTWSLKPCAPGIESDQEDQKLWLCGTAVTRAFGICEEVIANPEDLQDNSDVEIRSSSRGLTVTVIPDLTKHPRTTDRSYCTSWPSHRFYAGIPIQSRRGINIGALGVFDSKVRDPFDDASIQLMQELSRAIMGYFELRRSSETHGRGARMARGLGSFVEGRTTMTGLEDQSNSSFADADHAPEGLFNKHQQALQKQADDDRASTSDDGTPKTPSRLILPFQDATESHLESPIASFDADFEPTTKKDPQQAALEKVFSRAANVLRESIEVEGVLFVDASIRSFGGRAAERAAQGKPMAEQNHSSTSSSEDASTALHSCDGNASEDDVRHNCDVLGFSTSSGSSIDGTIPSSAQSMFPERLLHKLLRRYPKGKIFNYDENGSVQSSDFSSDGVEFGENNNCREQSDGLGYQPSRYRPKRPFSRQNEAKAIAALFPGARSVCLVPIWDSNKQRWFAGCFTYTLTPTRVFTTQGELSYLNAFSSVIMAEVALKKAALVGKAASDLMGSLSHELRSPLHGIVLGAELLRDTSLDVFQGDALHSLETCGRTLLDTIDHLLDWTKINNFMTGSSESRPGTMGRNHRGLRFNRRNSVTEGMKRIASDVKVDLLIEEVVESIYAGHTFQRQTVTQARSEASQDSDSESLRRLDNMHAADSMVSEDKHIRARFAFEHVSINLDIDPSVNWEFHSQPGALRRIVMNLLGNSLKYTTSGFIFISVSQEPPTNARPRTRFAHINIIDTGCGISEDYLRHHLFSPFTQEDSYTSGVGVGLSLVRQIVRALGGSIHVRSKVKQGTKITVKMPLELSRPSLCNLPTEPDDFTAQVSELSGLRITLLGFSTEKPFKHETWDTTGFDEQSLITRICQGWLKLHVIKSSDPEDYLPDLILCDERNLPHFLREPRSGLSIPVVVVCGDAVVARKLQKAYKSIHRQRFGVFGFISRPVGPRKLAKAISLCFKRWVSVQAAPMNTASISTIAGPYDNGVATPTHGTELEVPSGATGVGCNGDRLEKPSLDSQQTPRKCLSPTPPKKELDEDPRPRFLLVEDNPVNMKILQAYMKKIKLPYDIAIDGQKALSAYQDRRGRYQCILMDISMPIMDGFEATKQIRIFEQNQQLERRHIFALTGLASKDAQEEAFAIGIDLFLSKPVKLKELTQILTDRNILS